MLAPCGPSAPAQAEYGICAAQTIPQRLRLTGGQNRLLLLQLNRQTRLPATLCNPIVDDYGQKLRRL